MMKLEEVGAKCQRHWLPVEVVKENGKREQGLERRQTTKGDHAAMTGGDVLKRAESVREI